MEKPWNTKQLEQQMVHYCCIHKDRGKVCRPPPHPAPRHPHPQACSHWFSLSWSIPDATRFLRHWVSTWQRSWDTPRPSLLRSAGMLEKNKVMLTQALWIAMLFRLFVYSVSGSKRQHLKLSLHCTSPSFPTLFQCQASVIEKKKVNNRLCTCQRWHGSSQKSRETWLFERHICERQVPHTEARYCWSAVCVFQ